jgi:hypothetical protein
MRKIVLLLGAALLATPAAAQEPVFDESLDEDIARAIPPAEEVEAMAPAMDTMVAALLNVDIGPLLDAADPHRRRADHGARGRTLRELGRRDDPDFENRIRSSIYGTIANMGRMMEALAVAAPIMRRSLREFERSIEGAVGDYQRRRPVPSPPPEPEAPYPEE